MINLRCFASTKSEEEDAEELKTRSTKKNTDKKQIDSDLLQLIKKDLKEKKMRGKLGGQSSYSSGGMSSGGTGWQARGGLGFGGKNASRTPKAQWASSSFVAGPQGQPRQSYAPRPEEVQKLFMAQGIPHNLNGQELVVKFCPLCEKPHYNARDNMNTLCVNTVTFYQHLLARNKHKLHSDHPVGEWREAL